MQKNDSMALTSMILGIASLVLSCTFGGILAIVSIILGVIVLIKKKNDKGFAITGIIVSAVALVIAWFSICIYSIPIGLIGMYSNEQPDKPTYRDIFYDYKKAPETWEFDELYNTEEGLAYSFHYDKWHKGTYEANLELGNTSKNVTGKFNVYYGKDAYKILTGSMNKRVSNNILELYENEKDYFSYREGRNLIYLDIETVKEKTKGDGFSQTVSTNGESYIGFIDESGIHLYSLRTGAKKEFYAENQTL